MAECCPTCGAPVNVVGADEGTTHYEPVVSAIGLLLIDQLLREVARSLPSDALYAKANEAEPGDPRHKTAVEAAHDTLTRHALFLTPAEAEGMIVAYLHSLAEQGVVLVPRERCARDSDWCDGAICREPPHGNGMFPDCPNAEPVSEKDEPRRKEPPNA